MKKVKLYIQGHDEVLDIVSALAKNNYPVNMDGFFGGAANIEFEVEDFEVAEDEDKNIELLKNPEEADNDGDTAMQLSIDDERNMPAPTECGDAVSRRAMLDGFASIAKAKAKSDAQKSLMGRVMFFTEQLPPVTTKQRWIPVSERLPEDAYGCLVTIENSNPYTGDCDYVVLPLFVGYDGETWNNANGDAIPYEVVAWMPLPEPYKKGDNE